ncbi:MAG: hypothetical protein ABEJ98_02785 [Candidatus Nanohaloarchaea archaeon]
MPEPFTLRIDEVYVETIEQLEEEGYLESRTEGFIYAIDRSLESLNDDYVPVTRPDPEIDRRASEIFQQKVHEEEYPFNLYEFKQDSLELAKEASRLAEELDDEAAEEFAEEYVERYFPDIDSGEF